MTTINITPWGLAASYLLLLFPLGVMLWYRIPMVKRTLIAVLRMTVQLLFVGLYLQVVFDLNNFWLNSAWLIMMVAVADLSILRNSNLKAKTLILPLFIAILFGTITPTFFFLGPILHRPQLLDAQYAIPIAGMILGNCLRADIIAINTFYKGIRRGEKAYQHALGQGAVLKEAILPYLKEAFQSALSPLIATIATIGLVSLPGMMTGVILGGANPMTAIKYQIAIMTAILSGTAITVWLAIKLTMRSSFTAYGMLDKRIFEA
ncbi:ABC transporter permease [bacterium]|nr:ABC transporter permease [bacterium]MBU1652284.1 ABC transporter permease [bacterium]